MSVLAASLEPAPVLLLLLLLVELFLSSAPARLTGMTTGEEGVLAPDLVEVDVDTVVVAEVEAESEIVDDC